MGALRLGMAVLGAEQHRAAGQLLGEGEEESGRRADEHVAVEARPRRPARRDGPVRDLAGEAEPVLLEAVHLPVAGDKLASGQFRLHDPPPLNTRIREMLQAIRERAGSVIVKVLFGLLILSFAVWGIGDIFRRGGGETTVVEVGDRKISADQLREAYGAEPRSAAPGVRRRDRREPGQGAGAPRPDRGEPRRARGSSTSRPSGSGSRSATRPYAPRSTPIPPSTAPTAASIAGSTASRSPISV